MAILVAALALLVAVSGPTELHAQRFARPRQPLNPPPAAGQPQDIPGPPLVLRQGDRTAALADANARGLQYVPGEVLVKFRGRSSRWGRQRALASARSRASIDDVRWIGDMALVSDATQPDAVALARRLAAQGDVEFAEPNYLRRVSGARSGRWAALAQAAEGSPAGVPNDTDYSELQWNFNLIDMPRAWDINPGGSPDVVVAVLDTGMTTEAGSITEPIWTGSEFEDLTLSFGVSPDFTASRFTQPRDLTPLMPGTVVRDFSGHGTHVASTIVQDTNNRLALAGIAYRVRLMPVKVCLGYWDLLIARGRLGVPGFPPATAGACSSADVAAGIRYAVDNGARVINLSISGPSPSETEREALIYAAQRGVFVALAAGNEFETGNPTQYPAAFAASIEGVISVSAVDKTQGRASYSSTGTYVEIAAPGGSDFDTGGEDGGFVWQVTLFPPDSLASVRRPRFDRYAEVGYSGTSMAAPHVAGLGALLVSQGVTNPRAIEAFLKALAKDIGPSGTDTQFGHGLVQGRASVFGMGVWR